MFWHIPIVLNEFYTNTFELQCKKMLFIPSSVNILFTINQKSKHYTSPKWLDTQEDTEENIFAITIYYLSRKEMAMRSKESKNKKKSFS